MKVYVCGCGAVIDAEAWDDQPDGPLLHCPRCGSDDEFHEEHLAQPCEHCHGTGIA